MKVRRRAEIEQVRASRSGLFYFRRHAIALGGRGLAGVAVLTVSMFVMVMHGFQLGQLIRRQDAAHLLQGLLLNCMHLLMTILLRQLLVLPKSLHLLVTRGEDRLDLRCLLGRQIQPSGKHGRLALWIWCVVVVARFSL